MAILRVVGVKRFQGVMDDGKQIDSGKLFVECKFDTSRNGEREFASGCFVEELRLDSSAMVREIENLPLPALFEVQTERVGNGKTVRERVLSIRPYVPAGAEKQAARAV